MHPLFLSIVLAAAPAPATHRYALTVGENAGDASDEVLRFAVADARRVARTLVDVGGVEASDVTELDGADAKGLEEALARVSAAVAARRDADSQLVVYISAHADELNLHLRGTHFPLSRLREAVLRAPVNVALLVLDTCRSGSLTRVKGLKPVTGVALNIEAPDLKGRVILTSSGPDEDAQESDQLGGSYFTYHWTTGLRGPADASHDGVVTLQEAYDYAFARTVESTFANPAGVQHPHFLVDLKGEGELVLSDPAGSKARLVLAVDSPGEWLVVSEEGSVVLGRFQKAGGPVIFALPPGSYRVRTRAKDGVLEAHFTVPTGGVAVVREDQLAFQASDSVARRGSPQPSTLDDAPGNPVLEIAPQHAQTSVEPVHEFEFRVDASLGTRSQSLYGGSFAGIDVAALLPVKGGFALGLTGGAADNIVIDPLDDPTAHVPCDCRSVFHWASFHAGPSAAFNWRWKDVRLVADFSPEYELERVVSRPQPLLTENTIAYSNELLLRLGAGAEVLVARGLAIGIRAVGFYGTQPQWGGGFGVTLGYRQ